MILVHAPLRTRLRPPPAFDGEAIKRYGYHDQGIVVVSLDDNRLSWDQRQFLKQIGDKLFGARATPARS